MGCGQQESSSDSHNSIAICNCEAVSVEICHLVGVFRLRKDWWDKGQTVLTKARRRMSPSTLLIISVLAISLFASRGVVIGEYETCRRQTVF